MGVIELLKVNKAWHGESPLYSVCRKEDFVLLLAYEKI